jgi:hypothetical protein
MKTSGLIFFFTYLSMLSFSFFSLSLSHKKSGRRLHAGSEEGEKPTTATLATAFFLFFFG